MTAWAAWCAAHMGRVAQQTIEQIAAANDIVDVIGGYFPLKRAGAVYKALCPFLSSFPSSCLVTRRNELQNAP
jgi:DNA primase